eukprot:gene15432-21515_t
METRRLTTALCAGIPPLNRALIGFQNLCWFNELTKLLALGQETKADKCRPLGEAIKYITHIMLCPCLPPHQNHPTPLVLGSSNELAKAARHRVTED